MTKTKFRQIRNGEKLAKGTILSHQQPSDDRLVVTKRSRGDGYVDVKMTKGWANGRTFDHQLVSSFVVIEDAKPETPKQAIKRLTAELEESQKKNETDRKSASERASSLEKSHNDLCKYYEDRLMSVQKSYEDEHTARRSAEDRNSRMSYQIDAMKKTIALLGEAVKASAGIAQ